MAEFAFLTGLLGCLVNRADFDWAICMRQSASGPSSREGNSERYQELVSGDMSLGLLGWRNWIDGGLLGLARGVIARIPQQHASLVVEIEELLLRIDGPKHSVVM